MDTSRRGAEILFPSRCGVKENPSVVGASPEGLYGAKAYAAVTRRVLDPGGLARSNWLTRRIFPTLSRN